MTEKNNQGWDYPDPYVDTIAVTDEAIDVMGHVNNCQYFHWLEQVAWSHSQALGVRWEEYQALDRALVARETRVEYLAAGFAGDELELGTWISENDQRLSLTRIYQIRRKQDGVTLLRGYTKWVCVQISTGKPKRMPTMFRERYPVTIAAEGGVTGGES